jgi:Transposase DDE domain
MVLSQKEYCQFITSTHINVTCTYFAEHKEEFSHDSITRFLAQTSIDQKVIFAKSMELIVFSPRGWLIFDDSVIDKNYSSKIQMVRKQWSGNAHKVIRGIGLIGCVYYNPDLDEYWLLDYRLYDIEFDGKKKTDHMLDMIDSFEIWNRRVLDGLGGHLDSDNDSNPVSNPVSNSSKVQIQYQGVLCDAAYSTVKLFSKLEYYGKYYVCNIKSNRKARSFGTSEEFISVKDMFDLRLKLAQESDLEVDQFDPNKPIEIQLNQLNSTHKTYIFKSQFSTERTDYLVTNCPEITTLQQIQKINAYRWKIEQFHRELKGITGIDKCQCRKRNSQHNHIQCSLMVWVDMKQKFYHNSITVYRQKEQLLSGYLRAELKNPTLVFEW